MKPEEMAKKWAIPADRDEFIDDLAKVISAQFRSEFRCGGDGCPSCGAPPGRLHAMYCKVPCEHEWTDGGEDEHGPVDICKKCGVGGEQARLSEPPKRRFAGPSDVDPMERTMPVQPLCRCGHPKANHSGSGCKATGLHGDCGCYRALGQD